MTESAPRQRPVALITGGSSGIGSACVQALSATHDVWFTYHRGCAAAEAVLESIREQGGRAWALALDSGDRGSIRAAYDHFVCEQAAPRLDALVANAGTFGDGYRLLMELEEQEWDAVWATNTTGVIDVFRIFAGLLARGSTVVNVSTINVALGAIGYKSHAHYAASKAATDAFFAAVAEVGALRGVRCINLVPGLVETRMLHEHFAHELDAYRLAVPSQRFGEPEEIGRLVARLLSGEAELAIHRISADGGWLQKGWERIHSPP